MLGDLIYQSSGKRTSRRITAVEPTFSVEVSFEDAGKMLGIDGFNVGTYSSSNRADGTLMGQGKGVFATGAGDFVTWYGVGTGTLQPNGSVSYRGSLVYNTASPKFTKLNSVAGVF